MYWLRWFGFSLIGIGVAGLISVPWLRANGRADETGTTVVVAVICLALAVPFLLWRRGRGS